MTLLIASVLVVIVVSAMCSLTEAALYAVRLPYIRTLEESGNPAGTLLARFKRDMERPITAILIVNTTANTAGAAVAGAQARAVFGEGAVILFSALFTVAVLLLSEILPKIAGVTYSRVVAPFMSVPLNIIIVTLSPLVWLSEWISRGLKPSEIRSIAPEDEVRQFAMLSAEEGSILPFEAELIRNVLQLNETKARDIMTPRPVVVNAASASTLRDVADKVPGWPSRVPLYATEDPENWTGFVLRDNVLSHLARDKFDVRLDDLCQPLGFVPESMPGHRLLHEFLSRRAHLLGVVDEYGAVIGVVTLEDVMESLIGAEILDETDSHEDLQAEARRQARRRHPQSPSEPRSDAGSRPLKPPEEPR